MAIPASYGLGPLTVKGIAGKSVELTAPLTGSGYSISGCSGGGGTSSNGGGGVVLRCDKGTVAVINDTMNLQVIMVQSASAELRIKPAG
ncbi:hypothetical protein ACIBI4_00470 [Streptomyces sp. NPDC050418]|uniref:hypothetical protein n=1 Tax=Streptomyces sp. NPDC050418 TaxID=3365612 RepID=UPI003790534A